VLLCGVDVTDLVGVRLVVDELDEPDVLRIVEEALGGVELSSSLKSLPDVFAALSPPRERVLTARRTGDFFGASFLEDRLAPVDFLLDELLDFGLFPSALALGARLCRPLDALLWRSTLAD